MQVAVQHDAHVALLGRHQAVHRVERERVAVQASHHVQHVARNLGAASEGVGGQAVVDRADPACTLNTRRTWPDTEHDDMGARPFSLRFSLL